MRSALVVLALGLLPCCAPLVKLVPEAKRAPSAAQRRLAGPLSVSGASRSHARPSADGAADLSVCSAVVRRGQGRGRAGLDSNAGRRLAVAAGIARAFLSEERRSQCPAHGSAAACARGIRRVEFGLGDLAWLVGARAECGPAVRVGAAAGLLEPAGVDPRGRRAAGSGARSVHRGALVGGASGAGRRAGVTRPRGAAAAR